MLDAILALNGLDTRVFENATASGGAQDNASDFITVPDAHLLFNGDFKRVGTSGLKITGEDGQSFFIEDYFAGEKHKHLLSPEGAMLSAQAVLSFAGPLAPGQLAQADGQQPAAQAVVGRVDAISGSCTVIRNGVSVSLSMGDTVRKGDVVQTSSSSAISIVFTDGSTFSLSANARMVLNEFVYAANGAGNSAVINLVQGTFSFVAGQVAKTGDMRVETPVATMGIRGTAVLVEISANDGQTKFSVMVEPNGTTGSFNLYNKTTGALIATVNNSQIGWLVTPAGPLQVVAQQVDKTPAELQQELGIVQQLFNIFNNYQQNPIDPNQDPNRRGDNSSDPQTTGSIGSGGGPGSNQPSNYTVTITQIPNGNAPQNQQNAPSTPNPTNPNTNTPNPNAAGPDGGFPPLLQQTGTFHVINGTDGDDTIIGTPGNDIVFAGAGNDLITAGHGGGDDIYDGGPGEDTIEYPSASHGVTFHLNNGTYTLPGGQVVKASTADGVDVGHDIFVRIEKIVGSPGNDIFVLHDGGDWEIDAGAGVDIVRFANGLDLLNTPGGPDIQNFEIVDLKTDQTVDANGIGNVVSFDISELGNNGVFIGGHKVLRVLGDSHDRISVVNQYGLQGAWAKAPQTVTSDSVFLTDDLTDGVEFDVYTWTFGGNTETIYVQHGVVINSAPVFNDPKVNVFGSFELTEYQGRESLKLISGAIGENLLEFNLGLAPTEASSGLIEDLAPGGVTPTRGSGATIDVQLNAGEAVTTQWLFDANDRLPWNDFAFVAVTFNGQIVYSSLLSSVGGVGDFNQSGWNFVGYTAQNSGIYHVTFGVLDAVNESLPSDLYIAQPHVTLAPLVEDSAPEALLGLLGEPQPTWLTTSRTIAFSDLDPNQIFSVTAEFLNGSHLGIVDAEIVDGDNGPEILLSYRVDNAAVQYLGESEVRYEDIRITLSDGVDFVEQFFTVAIVGTNDVPTITVGAGDSSSALLGETDVGLSANGTLTIADVDAADRLTVGLVRGDFDVDGRLGSLTESQLHDFMSVSRGAADGNGGKVNWVFNSGSNAFDYLADGEQLILHYVVRVTDGNAYDDQIVNVTITGSNDGPVANVATGNGEAGDSYIAVNLTGSDVDGQISKFKLLTLPTNGSLYEVTSSGEIFGPELTLQEITATSNSKTLAFVPVQGWNGQTTLQFEAIDNNNAHSTAAVATINVAPNVAPTTSDATASGSEDSGAIAVVLTGSDRHGVASFKITDFPSHGALYFDSDHIRPIGLGSVIPATGNAATIYFVPNANFNGNATFGFAAVDALGLSDETPATATIAVAPVNDLPVTNAASGSGSEDTVVEIVLSGSDVEGVLSGFHLASLPANGSLFYDAALTQAVVTSGGTADITTNANSITLYFKPTADWNGSTSFSYAAIDGSNASGPGVIVPISVAAVADAPTGVDKTVILPEDDSYSFSASDFGYSDADGDGFVSVKIVSLPSDGRLIFNRQFVNVGDEFAVNNIGLLHFEPAENQTGNGYASFTFQVRDATGLLDDAPNTITFDVTPVNDAPFTNAASGSGAEDGIVEIVLSGSDIEGPLSGFKITALPANGALFYDAAGTQPVLSSGGIATVSSSGANSLTLYFKPLPDWNGSTSLSYAAVDAQSSVGNIVTAPITVSPVNDAPVFAGDRAASMRMSESYTLTQSDLGYTDIDDSDAGIVYTVSSQSQGTIKVNGVEASTFTAADLAAGHVTFLQDGAAAATASFTFTMDDGNEDGSTPFASTFNFEVTMSARPETNAPSTVTGAEDPTATQGQVAAIEIVLTGSDSDGSVASYKITSAPQHGQLFSDAALSQLITSSVAATGDAADHYETKVYFKPDANWDGSTSVQFAAVDDRGFADLSPATVKIDVTPVVDEATFSFGRGSVNLILNGGFDAGLSGWTTYGSYSNFYTTTAYDITRFASGTTFVYYLPGPINGAYAVVDPIEDAGASVLLQSFLVPYALEDLKISYDFFVRNTFSTHYNGDGTLASSGIRTTQFARIDVLNSGSGAYDTSPAAVVSNLFKGTTLDVDANPNQPITYQTFNAPGWTHVVATTGTGEIASLTSDQTYVLRFANMTTFRFPIHTGLDNVSVVAEIGSLGFQNGDDIRIGKIALGDTDGSEQITKLVLSGFEPGVIFKINGEQVGALQANGTWLIDDRDDVDALATTDLMASLPVNYTGSFTMTSVATVVDSIVLSNGQTQTATRDFTDTLKVEILAPNDAPIAANNVMAINEDQSRAFLVSDFAFGDSNNDAFLAVKIASLPAAGSGTLKLNGVAVTAGQTISVTDIAAGLLVFTPGANLSGTAVSSFTFQVQDNGGSGGYDQNGVGTDLSSVYTMSFDVRPIADAINFPAPATPAAADEDTVVTLGKLDISVGDPSETLGVSLSGFPAGAVFSLNGSPIGALDTTVGSPTFGRWVISNANDIAALRDSPLKVTLPANHDASFNLNVTVTTIDTAVVAGSTVTDSAAFSRTIAVTINPINDLPTANNDALTTNEDTALTINAATLLANDSDIETPRANLAVSAVGNATGGSVNLNGGNPIFTPTGGFSGIAGFDYTIRDANGGTATAHVTIDVAPRADQPLFTLGGSGNEDADITIGRVARGDADGSEQITKLVLSGFPAGATFKIAGAPAGALAADGTWVITDLNQIAALATSDLVMTPLANDNGAFTLTTVASVTDNATLSNGAASHSADFINIANVNVASINDAPTVAQPLADQNTGQHASFSYQFASTAFSDVDGQTLTYTAVLESGAALPSWLSFDPVSRTFSGTPTDAETLHVKVTASDGTESVSDVFDIVVAANRVPSAIAVTYPYYSDYETILTLSASDADSGSGDTLRYKFTDIPPGVAIYLDPGHTTPVTANQLFTSSTVYVVSAGLPAALTYIAVDSYGVESTPVNATAIIPMPATFVGTAGDDTADASAGVLTGFTGDGIGPLTDRVGDTFRPGGGTDTIVAGRGDDIIDILAAGEIGAGDVFNGGAGSNTLRIGEVPSVDLRVASLSNVQILSGGTAGNIVAMSIAQFLQFSAIDLGDGANRIDVYLDQDGTSGAPYDISGLSVPTLANVQTVNFISANSGAQYVKMSAAQAAMFSQIDLGDGTDALTIQVVGNFTLNDSKLVNVDSVTIEGDNLANILTGSSLNETINGNGGNDTLIGGKGVNTLQGGADNDLYKFDQAGGTNTVSDLEGTSTLSFRDTSGGTLLTAFEASRNAGALDLKFGLTNVAATINAGGQVMFETPVYGFANGTLKIADGLDGDALGKSLIAGTSGNDTITAHGVDNLLSGGAGNDTLISDADRDVVIGGTGDDTLINNQVENAYSRYIFRPGDGNDTIQDSSGLFVSSGWIVYGDMIVIDTQGAALSTLSFYDDNATLDAGNLVIRYGATDTITVANHFASFANGIEYINFNGGSFAGYDFGTGNYGISLLDHDFIQSPRTDRSIVAGAKDAANILENGTVLFGGDKADTLIANFDANLLVGGAGFDDFVFYGGYLSTGDIIADFQVGYDIIDLRYLQTNWSNLSISYDAGSNFTLVRDFTTELSFRLFGNIALTADDFKFSAVTTSGTFTGTAGNDRIDGRTGEIVGFTGSGPRKLLDTVLDYYTPGGGEDTIIGGSGGVQINLTSASDLSSGDVFVGGAGQNILNIGTISNLDLRGMSITGFQSLIGDAGPHTLTMSLAQYNAFQSINFGSGGTNQIYVDVTGATNFQTFGGPSLTGAGTLHLFTSGNGNESLTIYGGYLGFADVDMGAGDADEVRIVAPSNAFDESLIANHVHNAERITIVGPTITGSGTLNGTRYGDTLIAASSGEFFNLYGNGGDDTLYGNALSTFFRMGLNDGHDTVYGGTGTNTLAFADYLPFQNTIMSAIDITRTGSDSYHVTYANSSVDYVGGSGILKLEIGASYNNALFRLDIPTTFTWTFANGLTGTEGSSVLVGANDQNDTITSFDAANLMFGGGGNDTLIGGTDILNNWAAGLYDVYVGGTGNDTLINYGTGQNAYVFAVGDGLDTINDYGGASAEYYYNGDRIFIGGPGTALSVLNGFHDNAALTGSKDLTIQYGAGDKVTIVDQYAGNGHNIEWINFNGSTYHGYSFGYQNYRIHTQASGPDNLQINSDPSFSVGNKGVSNILGSSLVNYDDDLNPNTPPVLVTAATNGGILIGADQSDTLYGGYFADLLIGGGGADTFKFSTRDARPEYTDLIDDFQQGLDKIDVSRANYPSMGQDNYISFASLTQQYDEVSNITTLTHHGIGQYADDASYGFSLKLYGRYTLTADDFIFL